MKFFAIILLQLLALSVSAQNTKLALVNLKLYRTPDLPPIESATVLINHGKFEAVGSSDTLKIPAGYTRLDYKGKFASAGFWNCHVHFIESKWNHADKQPADSLEAKLKDMLISRGFVYAFDLAQLEFSNLNYLRQRIASGEIKGPTIFAVGVPFTSRSPYYIHPAVLPELKTSEAVRAHIENQFRSGANGIKTWSASPTGKSIDYLSDSLLRAAAKQTKEKGIPLFAHPSNNAGLLKAVRNGVTVLTHVSPDDRVVWDAATVSEMLKANIALIPTLQLYTWASKLENLPLDNPLVLTAVNQLSVFQQAGGTVLFGTDVGYMTDYDPTDEFALMNQAGMSFGKILAALTINPATRFNMQQRTGKIQKGLDADLVIFDKDPGTDVRNFTSVNQVFHKGVVLYEKGK